MFLIFADYPEIVTTKRRFIHDSFPLLANRLQDKCFALCLRSLHRIFNRCSSGSYRDENFNQVKSSLVNN